MDQKTLKLKMSMNRRLRAEKFWLISRLEVSAGLICIFIGVTGKSSGAVSSGMTLGESVRIPVSGLFCCH